MANDAERKRWYLNTITPSTERTLRDLSAESILTAFYLAGGTGLALQLGHRTSEDLDFFSTNVFDEEALIQHVQRLAGFRVVTKSPSTLHANLHGTKVSFLGYSYPLLFPQERLLGVAIADSRDIASMKISAIASRGTRRDFIDLYVAAQRFGLFQLLRWFDRKYAQASYSRVYILKSLTYFEDAEKDPCRIC